MTGRTFKQFFEGCGLRHSDEENYSAEQLDELGKELQQRSWWHDLDAGLEGAHSDRWKEDPRWKDSFHNNAKIGDKFGFVHKSMNLVEYYNIREFI